MRVLQKLVLLAVVGILVAGCDKGNRLLEPTTKKIVLIERCVQGDDNPGFKLACDTATLDYHGRTLEIQGVSHIGGYINGGWVADMKCVGDKVVISLSADADYEITIGAQEHHLPFIVGEK